MSEHLNLAKLKKGGEVFEIAVDPDKAMDFKKGKANIEEALKFPKIFSDVKKGMPASEISMKKTFKTTDVNEIAKKIILEGEVQLTAEYRKQIQEQKRKQIIFFITRNGIDPRTKLPHPPQRIEDAMNEAKVNVDCFKSVDEQVKEIIPKLQIIIPLKFVMKEIDVTIPAEFSGKAHTPVKQFGKIMRESWDNDGSWHVLIEIPGGLEMDFYDKINSLTHGSAVAMVKAVK